ncbi:uncharacterized protein LOC134819618 isoform X2 [Bolinopsis microptera]|uniref:uncharacterized protein LOC134819618 isoform X2 n=1 Tax=Bolinopsis microptera TaxID=2820187 RepID=UPI003079709C
MIRLSLRKFPLNKELEDATGIPWGCSLEPLTQIPPECIVPESCSKLARCHNCYSYINCFTVVNKTHWHCMMCHSENEVIPRYANATPQPELSQTLIELDISPDAEDNALCPDPPMLPIYIGVVDVTGCPDFIKTVQKSLYSIIDNLADDSLFGLVVYDERIGVYNLYCAKPHVRHVRIANGSCPINLQEMIQHDDTLVRVGDMRKSIYAAIDNISQIAQQGGNRCFGAAVQSLVEFFSVYQGHTTFRARLLTFLSGPCTFGVEALTQRRSNTYKQGIFKSKDVYNEGVHKKVFQAQSNFYKDLGMLASSRGVSVDVYVVSSEWVDLASIRSVCELTGGRLVHYTDPVECSLSKDCATLAKLYGAGRGMLRIRTSAQFRVSKVRGPCAPDPYRDDVLHAAGLDLHQAFAAEFAFYRGSVNAFEEQRPAIVQLTFAYTNELGQRKLRIQTLKISTVEYIENMFDNADPEVITKLFVYRSLDACYRWGVNEGRVNVLDTYVYLLSHYNETLPYDSQEFDVEFSVYPHLQIMAALVYGMFICPFMSCRPDISLDQLVAFQSKCISANPEHLALLFYPHLMSFEDPHQSPGLSLPLSPITVKSVQNSFILLDAYDTIIVLQPQLGEAGKDGVEATAIEFSEISLEPKNTLAVDSNKVKPADLGTIDKYVDEAQRTRPLNVNVVNTSNPAPICKYLINDSGAVNICMPGSSYDHYYWRGYKAFYKFIVTQLHRLYDPEGESDYEEPTDENCPDVPSNFTQA